MLIDIYLKFLKQYLLYMLLLMWERLLRLFRNNLEVLEVMLFSMESYCIYVVKSYLNLIFSCN